MNGTDEFLTVLETAQLLNRTRQTIYDSIANGRWLILRSEADAALARRSTSKTGGSASGLFLQRRPSRVAP